jgi:hypothetical protein
MARMVPGRPAEIGKDTPGRRTAFRIGMTGRFNVSLMGEHLFVAWGFCDSNYVTARKVDSPKVAAHALKKENGEAPRRIPVRQEVLTLTS